MIRYLGIFIAFDFHSNLLSLHFFGLVVYFLDKKPPFEALDFGLVGHEFAESVP